MPDPDLCQNCKTNEAVELHECPYAVDINDDYSECNCCSQCEQDCADDI
jgi:hypothetical protein